MTFTLPRESTLRLGLKSAFGKSKNLSVASEASVSSAQPTCTCHIVSIVHLRFSVQKTQGNFDEKPLKHRTVRLPLPRVDVQRPDGASLSELCRGAP